MRHCDFAILVATLLLIGHLVLDLNRTGTCLDHLLGQQVCGFLVTKARIDIRDDGNDVSLEVINFVKYCSLLNIVIAGARSVEFAEQTPELPCISLTQEGVKLFDQAGYRAFLVHRLIG